MSSRQKDGWSISLQYDYASFYAYSAKDLQEKLNKFGFDWQLVFLERVTGALQVVMEQAREPGSTPGSKRPDFLEEDNNDNATTNRD